MPREVQQSTLDMIDEVLVAEDPTFMESLEDLSPEKLNQGPITTNPSKEEIKASRRNFKQIWRGLSRWQQIVLFYGSFICFIAAPILFLSMKGIFTPHFGISEIASMEDYADEVIDLDPLAPDKDLMKIFRFDEFIFDLREHVVNLKPKDGIRFGRFTFSVEVKSEKDIAALQNRHVEMLDVISAELRQVDYLAFRGVHGKRRMRRRLVQSLRSKVSPEIFNLYYKLIVFNQ